MEYILKLAYCIDVNTYNFILNLVLESLDFETGLGMFDLVFDEKINVGLVDIDVSKGNLKFLLKY